MGKAKFNGAIKIKPGQAVVTTSVISKDNPNQVGEGFRDFVTLINTTPGKFNKLRIVLSDMLNRHYIGAEAALAWGDKWIANHEPVLKELNKEIEYEIIRWSELRDTEEFKENFAKVTAYYNEDIVFQNIVRDIALEHSIKKENIPIDNAINYSLEECAVSLMITGHEIYPAEGLNEAIKAVVKHFKCDKRYVGYHLELSPRQAPTKQVVTDGQLLRGCMGLTFMMASKGIKNPEAQAEFFKRFVEMTEQFEREKQFDEADGSISPSSDPGRGNKNSNSPEVRPKFGSAPF